MEENAFLEFVGDTPTTRLLDLLITGREFDYTLTEMSQKANMSWSTLHRIFPNFLKHRIVKGVREVGRAKLYKLNIQNPLVKKYVDIYDSIIMEELKRASQIPVNT
jgi:AraC-like DNA-binding protein